MFVSSDTLWLLSSLQRCNQTKQERRRDLLSQWNTFFRFLCEEEKQTVGGNNSGAGHFYFDRGIKQLLNLEDDMEKDFLCTYFFYYSALEKSRWFIDFLLQKSSCLSNLAWKRFLFFFKREGFSVDEQYAGVVTMAMKINRKGSDWALEGWDPNIRRLSYKCTTLIKVNFRFN